MKLAGITTVWRCLGLFAVLLSLGACDGRVTADADSLTNLGTAEPSGNDDPKRLAERIKFNWRMNCQGCHGPDGSGSAARGVPPLVALNRFQRIPEGREFLIRVPGMARSPLTDDELTELANWMMQEFSQPESLDRWEPYTTAEVAVLRDRPIVDRIAAHRAELLRKLGSPEI